MKLNENESRVSFLNYLNTTLLTAVCTILMFVFTAIDKIKTGQEDSGKEITRLKVIAEETSSEVSGLQSRVHILEKSNFVELQSWVDANYIRKPQR